MIDADHIVRGDGIAWMRALPGRGRERAHPPSRNRLGLRRAHDGNQAAAADGSTAATIIPSVGCPMGCNFCTTSAFFGGKGKFLNFYDTGDELFDVMSEMEAPLEVHSFFIMDENFLLHKRRAMELLERMKARAKAGRSTSSPRPTPSASTPCGNWWNWAFPGSGWAWNRRAPPTPS